MDALFKWIKILEDILGGSLFIIGLLISLWGVFTRYVLGISQFWTTEIFTMLFVWAIFIGFGTALRDKAHISIDLIYDRVSQKWKNIFDGFAILIGIVFSVFLFVTGLDILTVAYEQGGKTLDVQMPIWITYLILPVGGLLLFVHFIENALRHFGKMKRVI